MSRKAVLHSVLVAILVLAGAQAASAKIIYSYAVKFVCGYNPDNVGIYCDLLDKRGGEPTVKFGNYATDINIYNFNIYGDPNVWPPFVEKRVLLLVDRGVPVGREPRTVGSSGGELITLPYGNATMDDCNRIAELLWGSVPTPYPLTIGYLILASVYPLDVTAVYTAETCSYWIKDDKTLQCLDPEGRQMGMSISENVVRVEGRKMSFPTGSAAAPAAAGAKRTGGKK